MNSALAGRAWNSKQQISIADICFVCEVARFLGKAHLKTISENRLDKSITLMHLIWNSQTQCRILIDCAKMNFSPDIDP